MNTYPCKMHLMTPGSYQESKYIYDPWFVLNIIIIQYNPLGS